VEPLDKSIKVMRYRGIIQIGRCLKSGDLVAIKMVCAYLAHQERRRNGVRSRVSITSIRSWRLFKGKVRSYIPLIQL